MDTIEKNSEDIYISPEESELWEMCDIKLAARLTVILNYCYLKDLTENDDDEVLYEHYNDLVDRYERIDISKLDSRFKPEIITEVHLKILEMVYVLNDYKNLSDYIKKFRPLMNEFQTERYQAYRNTVNELERDLPQNSASAE